MYVNRHLHRLGDHCWYMDTDSLMFSADSEYQPPTGKFLGDLTSELKPDEEIREFVACAHKSYSVKIINNTTGDESYRTKAKGINNFQVSICDVYL